jgi:23S rRNA (pseudouridine1915-N3)-methyltransferase
VKLRIVAVGAVKERAARALVDDYLGRIRRACACAEIELRPVAPVRMARALDKALEGATVVALEPTGRELSSRELAARLERLLSTGKGVVAFVIGGADGLPAGVAERATERWSLSRLTLPHRLARVVLAEQLYRALTILRGEPYDH